MIFNPKENAIKTYDRTDKPAWESAVNDLYDGPFPGAIKLFGYWFTDSIEWPIRRFVGAFESVAESLSIIAEQQTLRQHKKVKNK